ncbi:MoaD/ThiS family protein [Methanolapillus millepedarum]|uniref:MoaD/ThiS family protein n=1 Tax=Methanolapillus millepedarum TaxID=3028296 RepID=A0AA96ZVK1_9EURY|nr:hypothetical protein MsAc7_04660 [Methanosarcinaceae archaeon Ac7]
MKITILAYGRLREYFPEKTETAFSENTDLKEILRQFSLENDDGGSLLFDCSGHLRRNIIVQVNKKRIVCDSAASFFPKDGDEIILYPPVSGG